VARVPGEARQLLFLGTDVQLHVPVGRRVQKQMPGKPRQKVRGCCRVGSGVWCAEAAEEVKFSCSSTSDAPFPFFC